MKGIIIRQSNPAAESKAKRNGLKLKVAEGWEIAFERSLFVGPSAEVQWDLVKDGFGFLERWEVAAALAPNGLLARDLGGEEQRQQTLEAVGDLRVPVYSTEVLFVRRCQRTQELIDLWRAGCQGDTDERLAFVRAVHTVKPILATLPRFWFREVAAVSPKAERSARRILVQVEVAPGRYVCCYPGQEEIYRERFRERSRKRSQ